MRARIKICGIPNPQVAREAVVAGADALGLIFYPPSRRHLSLTQAAAICRAVPPFIATVAVLVNPEPQTLRRIIAEVNPTHLQFHGEESPEFCAAFAKPYIKTLRVREHTDLAVALPELAARFMPNPASTPTLCQGILLDAYHATSYGGSGVSFDWQRTIPKSTPPLILAGGLTPENVAHALTQLPVYGVDVSSGVETDGRKDITKIREFCRQCLGADE